jgi:hypothetical protein
MNYILKLQITNINAFVQLKAAIDEQDTNMVSQANEKLDKGRRD